MYVASGQRDLINKEWKINILSLPKPKVSTNLLPSVRSAQLSQENHQAKVDQF